MHHLYALSGIALISFSPIFVALAAVSPVTATFYRCFYALPALYLVRRFVGSSDRPARLRSLAFASGVVLATDLSAWHRSIELIGAGLATVLANTQVIFVALFGWFLYRERPAGSTLVALPVVLAGVGLIAGLGEDDAFGRAPVTGALYGLASGLLYASFLVIFRASNPSRAPSVDPLFDATAGAGLGALVLGIIDPGFGLAPSWPAHGFLLALALGPQVTGWLVIAHVLPRLPALETSWMLLLQPTLALVWAALLLGERIAALQGLGIVLVVGGVGFVSLTGATRRPRAAPAGGSVPIKAVD